MKNDAFNLRFSVLIVLIVFVLGPLLLAQNPGILIDSVLGPFDDGVWVNYAKDDGVQVSVAGDDGVYVFHAGNDGVDVQYAGNDGLYVNNVGGDGVHVQNASGWSMNIQGDRSGFGDPVGHIAQIYNRSSLTSPDVLALKVGTTGNPGAGANFITFFNGNDNILGEVQGNGMGGITYASTGADYAEYLPALDHGEHFLPGDVVGVHQGLISKHTAGAAQVMVVTDQAAVLGNMPRETSAYQKVSFIGQLPVRVRGPVRAGDWIVPDGEHQGVGIALSSQDITPDHQIVGQAWESSADLGVKRVNTVVGLDHSPALRQVITTQEKRIESLEAQMQAILKMIGEQKEKALPDLGN